MIRLSSDMIDLAANGSDVLGQKFVECDSEL
jgi:hypothetical protein